MIKVECVSCKSPYDVDERRVPDSGMKMRCPKCNTSFLVNKDGTTSAAAPGPAVAPPPAVAGGPKLAPPPAFGKTMLGQQAPGAIEPPPSAAAAKGAFKGTMIGLTGPALVPPPATESSTDLPAVKPGAVPHGSLTPPSAAAGGFPKGALAPSTGPLPASQAANPRGGAATAFGAPAPVTPIAAPKREDSIGLVDLPAPKIAGKPDFDFGDSSGSGFEVDLPAPVAPKRQESVGLVDLPAPVGAKRQESVGVVDLPAPKASAADGGVDLPAPKLAVDLPAPKRAPAPTMMGNAPAAAPGGFGEIDLPAPKVIADLPAPRGVADLPVARGAADLPAPKGGGFGELDLPMPKPPPGPDSDEASFGDIELPDLPAAHGNSAPRGSGFGDIELPPPRAGGDIIPPKAPTVQGGHRAVMQPHDESSFGDLNPRADSMPPSLMGGGDDEASFGDVNPDEDVQEIGAPASTGFGGGSMPPALMGDDDDDDELGSDDLVSEGGEAGELGGEEGGDFGEEGLAEGDSEEDMEFGMADGDDVALPPEMLRRQRGEAVEEDPAAKSKRTMQVVIGVFAALLLLGGGGAALGLTDYGLFGVYYLERFMNGAGDPQFVQGAIARAEKIASTDTFRDVRRSLSELGIARKQAGLNRELLARSLMHEALFLVRYGAETNSASHVAPLLLRLQERHNVAPGMDLALAAEAASRQVWGEVGPHLAAARTQSANDPYVDLIAGEVAIRQGQLGDAEKAFGSALKNRGGARAQWGLARVAIAKNDTKAAQAAIEATLQLSPLHVDARIAQARILWGQGKEERAINTLRQALGLEAVDDQFLWTSKPALAQGYAVLGYVHEQRARLPLARKAYEDALAADPYLVEGLLGAGRVLLRSRGAADALARFESALNIAQKSSNPVVLTGRKADIEARLGQGRAQLALSKGPEAKGVLSVLLSENPNDPEIILAVGQAEEQLGNKDAAETSFKKSIELAPTVFAGYLALSQFYSKQNQADRASETLNLAATKVEESAEMRRMLGASELARNRLESAVHEYERAVELDPHDLDAKFGLAMAYRKTGSLDRSRGLVEEIAKKDPQYPGLALETGQLFEAQGEYTKAAESYKIALEKEPTNMDLMLRLGAAQVEGNLFDEAEQTLQKVIRETPNSADAEYFIGRIAFGRGRGPDALSHFDRALALDATQAVYHLYAARAALSMQNLGRTNEEVQLAISRDPSLGDAYWVRGEVRLRAGLVKDALKDLQKALALKPDRFEVYAAMAECYDQLRQLGQSVEMWRTALDKQPKNGEWWFKLARQYLDMGNSGSAATALDKARELGDATAAIPYWLPEAYRLSGEVSRLGNNKKAAIVFYKRYLEIAEHGAPDRDEVRKFLREWEVELADE